MLTAQKTPMEHTWQAWSDTAGYALMEVVNPDHETKEEWFFHLHLPFEDWNGNEFKGFRWSGTHQHVQGPFKTEYAAMKCLKAAVKEWEENWQKGGSE